jgi:ring-1,2-phenylacetyl-CoA epoxidase subunit PaaC
MQAPVDYLLQLADSALILGQRNAEWCGHAPVLEEDMAMANVSLDLIGQARLLYQYAAARLNAEGRDAPALTEDSLAYFRDVPEFRNYTLLELPHFPSRMGLLAPAAAAERDFATTIARNFLYSAYMALLWEALQDSKDEELAAIAAKSLKETRYHLRHSRDWLVRLGDGTAESHQRLQSALQHLMPYTQEFWFASEAESAAAAQGTGVLPATLQADWDALVDDALQEATLQRPPAAGYVTQGKCGRHSEHLGYVLGEMQGLARQHPGASW